MDNQQLPATEAEDTEPSNLIKNILLTIGGVALIFAILVLMPMVFTYISNGDPRP